MAEKILKQIITDLCALKDGVPGGRQHMDKDCLFIRPTGNPLNLDEWDEMMNREDVDIIQSKLISINKLRVVDEMAYACYTAHSEFNIDGESNDDIAVFSAVFNKILPCDLDDGGEATGDSDDDNVGVMDIEPPTEGYKSHYRGVRWGDGDDNEGWFIHIYLKGEKNIIGPYPTELLAAKKYDRVVIEHRGKNTKVNFPRNTEKLWKVIHIQRSTGRTPDSELPFEVEV